jgi:ribosomal protein S27AE
LAAQKRYRQTPDGREQARKQSEKYRNNNPLKIRARQILYNALRRGDIKKAPCEDCGSDKAQAHHEDYSRPLDVKWKCARCHTDHHLGDAK